MARHDLPRIETGLRMLSTSTFLGHDDARIGREEMLELCQVIGGEQEIIVEKQDDVPGMRHRERVALLA